MRNLINQAVYGTKATKDVFEELKALDSQRQSVLKEFKKRETQTNIYVGNIVNRRWNPQADSYYQGLMKEMKAYWAMLKQADKEVHDKICALEQYVVKAEEKESFEDLIHRRVPSQYNIAKLQKESVSIIDNLNTLAGLIEHFLELFKEKDVENNVNLILVEKTKLSLIRLLQAVTFIKCYKEPLKIHKNWG